MNDSFVESSQDERIFTLDDVVRLFVRLKKRLIQIALLGAVFAFLFVALRVPQYKAEATFKEENESKDSHSILQNLMGGGIGGSNQPQASTLMKSFQVLKPLAESLGLQATVRKPGFLLTKVYRRLSDNWKAERGLFLSDIDMFDFKDVHYEGTGTLSYTICFQDPDHFTILEKGKTLALGTLKVPVSLPDCTLTVEKTPSWLKIKASYPLQIFPWIPAAESLRKGIQIVANKNNSSILDLSFSHRDRFFASQVLNQLMTQYQRYLKSEHDQTALEQLDYLSRKKADIYNKMAEMFEQHADYLKENIESKGVAGLEDELASLLIPYQKMQQNILGIDIELSQIKQNKKEEGSVCLGEFLKVNQPLLSRLQELKQQRDLLEVSFQSSGFLETLESGLVNRQQALRDIRNKKEKAEKFLENQGSSDSEDSFFVLADPVAQEDKSQYVANYVRLLSVQEKILQEKCFNTDDLDNYFDGIDLALASSLFTEYNNKLDGAENLMRYYQHLMDRIEADDFEISSLSSVLQDPLSHSLIADANKIAVQLKDEKYHSEKEGQRWKEELLFQKRILKEHLGQLYTIEEIHSQLSREKLVSLQRVRLECINREISVVHEGMRDTLINRKNALIQEKEVLQEAMKDLRHISVDFPEKWKQEKLLKLNSEIALKMIGVMTELVEGKTVTQHLHRIESRPLDLSFIPLIPKKPGLIQGILIGAFGAGFFFFFIAFIRTLLSGFPTTLEKLKVIQYPTAGELSPCCDGPSLDFVTGDDLDVLRRISLFIESDSKSKIIGLIGGKGPDYSYALAENFARMSHKSLIVRCDFENKLSPCDVPGILQVWKGDLKELPLREKEGFDYLTSGGFTIHGTEVIQSNAFSDILQSVKEKYDSIFLLFRTPLSSAESTAALRICDKAVVTVCGEPLEELSSFVRWAKEDKKTSRLTFVTSNKI
jgi:hypothetical protein